MVEQTQQISDLDQPRTLLGIVHFCVRAGGDRFDIASQKVVKPVNSMLEVLAQPRAQQMVHDFVLVARFKMLRAGPLKLGFKGSEFLRKTSDPVQ
jgi:hypothetical protein